MKRQKKNDYIYTSFNKEKMTCGTSFLPPEPAKLIPFFHWVLIPGMYLCSQKLRQILDWIGGGIPEPALGT